MYQFVAVLLIIAAIVFIVFGGGALITDRMADWKSSAAYERVETARAQSQLQAAVQEAKTERLQTVAVTVTALAAMVVSDAPPLWLLIVLIAVTLYAWPDIRRWLRERRES